MIAIYFEIDFLVEKRVD